MTTNFQELRDKWALKASNPSKDWINMEAEKDRLGNPHNEPYPNKRPRRTEAEIISDLAYTFADTVLGNIYGPQYSRWLKENCEEKWGVWKYRF